MRIALLTAAAVVLWAAPAFAHCQIPCGIYDDAMRLDLIAEHIATIEKSMQGILELSKETPQNISQIARWTVNKEDHAQYIQDIAAQYFLAQRIKPTDPADAPAYGKYVRQLALLHGLIVEAMRAKQTTDPAHVQRLRELLKAFRAEYLGETEPHAHPHPHAEH